METLTSLFNRRLIVTGRRRMRGEVFPELKGRGFRSSSVQVVSRQLTNVAWADRLKTFLRKRAIDIKPVTWFIGGSFNFSRNLVADNLLAKSPAVYQICLSSKFFCHPRLNTIEFTVDQVVEILPADVRILFIFWKIASYMNQ